MRTTGGLSHLLPFLLILSLAAILPSAAAAQTDVLTVLGTNVGIGDTTPDFKLDVEGAGSRVEVTDNSGTTAARTLFKLANNGFPRFVLQDNSTGDQWLMAVAAAGSFVFGKVGTGVNEMTVQAGGHVSIPGTMTAQQYATSSSIDLKQDFAPVDRTEILARLAGIPIREWSFKEDGSGARHLGPTAQDFRAAFGLGEDDQHIGLMDAAGVTMAAVQGLYEMMQAREAEIQELRRQNEALAGELAALKGLVADEEAASDQGGGS